MSPLLDVVIPTATFNDRVEALLSDLQGELESYRDRVGRVIVVDNVAVADVTAELLLSGDRTVTHWPSQENGPALNRNRGARGSEATWLVFLDDDVRLEVGWAHATVALLDGPSPSDLIGAAIGSQRPRNWFSQASEDFVVRHRQYPEGWYLAAAHLLVRRSAFEALGGFDTTFPYGGEDWDLSRRAHAKGLSVDVVPWPAVAHANPTTWPELRAKAAQYGKANAALDEGEPSQPVAVSPAATDNSSVPSPAYSDDLPSLARGLGWAAEEYRVLRRSGRGRLRSLRSVSLYIPWMATYLRSQSTARVGDPAHVK